MGSFRHYPVGGNFEIEGFLCLDMEIHANMNFFVVLMA